MLLSAQPDGASANSTSNPCAVVMLTTSPGAGVTSLPVRVATETPPAGASTAHAGAQSSATGLPTVSIVAPADCTAIASSPGLSHTRPPPTSMAGRLGPVSSPVSGSAARSRKVRRASPSKRTTPPPARSMLAVASPVVSTTQPATTSSPVASGRAPRASSSSVRTVAPADVAATSPNTWCSVPSPSSPPPSLSSPSPPCSTTTPPAIATRATPVSRSCHPAWRDRRAGTGGWRSASWSAAAACGAVDRGRRLRRGRVGGRPRWCVGPRRRWRDGAARRGGQPRGGGLGRRVVGGRLVTADVVRARQRSLPPP